MKAAAACFLWPQIPVAEVDVMDVCSVYDSEGLCRARLRREPGLAPAANLKLFGMFRDPLIASTTMDGARSREVMSRHKRQGN
jgi:hypothetical protein